MKNKLGILIILGVFALGGCSSSETVENADDTSGARLMTAPKLQKDIQKAQTTDSLGELYAQSPAPKIDIPAPVIEKPEAQPLEAKPEEAPITERTLDDVTQDIAQQRVPDPLDPSQSNPLVSREEQARINSARAANDRSVASTITATQVAAPQPFYILGEVRKPGRYAVVPDMDVFKALAIAGGLTPDADDDEFIIYRGTGKNRKEIEANEKTPVLPGDSIKVEEKGFF